VKDDKRCGRPATSWTDDNITAIDKMVEEDRKVTSQLIADTLGILKTVVLQILREDLKKRKLCWRFVPHALTREQMDERVAACQDLLNMINGDKNFSAEDFSNAMNKLETRANLCITCNGSYFE
jgi:GTP-sensing pleiotropic transcriptional regulator CodY